MVNLASRIESIASSGDALISESTAKLIEPKFDLKPSRIVDLKGKGPRLVFSVMRGDQASHKIAQDQPIIVSVPPKIEQSIRVTETKAPTRE